MEEIKGRNTQQTYFHQCKHIWKTHVPKHGQADCLQGELLREMEKLRWEAQENGNRNWDSDYSYFCDFIGASLSEQPVFSTTEKEEICSILSYLKECGEYAQKFYNGQISEDDVDMEKIAYVYDDLYDILCDKIGKLQESHPEPIPYQHNDTIQR